MTRARHRHLISILGAAEFWAHGSVLDPRGQVISPDQIRDALTQLEARAAQEWAALSVRHKENTRRMQEFLGQR